MNRNEIKKVILKEIKAFETLDYQTLKKNIGNELNSGILKLNDGREYAFEINVMWYANTISELNFKGAIAIVGLIFIDTKRPLQQCCIVKKNNEIFYLS